MSAWLISKDPTVLLISHPHKGIMGYFHTYIRRENDPLYNCSASLFPSHMFLFTRVKTQRHRHVAMTTDREESFVEFNWRIEKTCGILLFDSCANNRDTQSHSCCAAQFLILINTPKYILFESLLGLRLSEPVFPAVQQPTAQLTEQLQQRHRGLLQNKKVSDADNFLAQACGVHTREWSEGWFQWGPSVTHSHRTRTNNSAGST